MITVSGQKKKRNNNRNNRNNKKKNFESNSSSALLVMFVTSLSFPFPLLPFNFLSLTFILNSGTWQHDPRLRKCVINLY